MKNTLKIKGKSLKLTTLGFTLIELLAVIVILAIIALIATPIVLNIINDTKESSLLRSAEFYLDAVETSIAQSTLNDKKLENGDYNILSNGNLCIEYETNECIKQLDVKVNGERPIAGTIILKNGKIKDVELVLSGKTIIRQNNKLLYSGLYDDKGNLLYTWNELVTKYGIDIGKYYYKSNGELLVEESLLPGVILSTNEKLKKGVKLIIDSTINRIGNGAFYGCATLKEIIITNNVTEIGRNAFRDCLNLKEIKIPNKVTYIGHSAFRGCKGLKSVIIGNSVTSTDNNVFSDCSSLNVITFPKGITYIGGWICSACTKLKTINYTGTEVEWNAINFHSSWNYGPVKGANIIFNYID